MKLVLPSAEYKDSFIEAVKEFQTSTADGMDTMRYLSLSVSTLEDDFDSFVEKQRGFAMGKNLPEGYLPNSVLWLVDGDAFIGVANIRHSLNERLLKIGGHIGYAIRPSKRGMGYGNKILELALPEAKKLGIDKVLVTCDETNIASRKIIEKNGGVLENKVPNPETGIEKLRFWIDILPA